jgi:hypothetical protein
MRWPAHATVFALALSTPVLAGVMVDHCVVSVLGAPGGCSSNCAVGGANPSNPGQAHGGYQNGQVELGPPDHVGRTGSLAGTIAVFPGATGREVLTTGPGSPGTASGNFTNPNSPHGHCTGSLSPC